MVQHPAVRRRTTAPNEGKAQVVKCVVRRTVEASLAGGVLKTAPRGMHV
jgi:hypothetical protein